MSNTQDHLRTLKTTLDLLNKIPKKHVELIHDLIEVVKYIKEIQEILEHKDYLTAKEYKQAIQIEKFLNQN